MMGREIGSLRAKYVAILVVAAVLLLSSLAGATTGVLAVGSGTLTLTENHYGSVIMTGSNATLDCDGFAIRDSTQTNFCGTGANESCGVYILNAYRPYVKDCDIRYFDIGIYSSGSNQMKIRNSYIRSNVNGVEIRQNTGHSDYRIENNVIRSNDEMGIAMRDSNGIRINSNSIKYNDTDGIDINDGNGARIYNNWLYDNNRNGLELDDHDSSFIYDNSMNDNGHEDNHSGISLDRSNGNYFYGNESFNNERNGIRITDNSDGNLVLSNSGSSNDSGIDAYQSGSCDGNLWSGNTYGTYDLN